MSKIPWTCRCGAHYQLPASAVGKNVRCKKCGHRERLLGGGLSPDADGDRRPITDVGPIPIVGEPIPVAGDEPTRPAGLQLPGDLDVIIEEAEHPSRPLQRRSFWADVAYSFTLLIEPGNLPAFGVCAFFNLLALGLLVGGVGIATLSRGFLVNFALCVLGVLAFGWLFAYYMRIIMEVAANEDDLPSTLIGDPFEAVFKPLFTFVATWFCLLLPAITLAVIEFYWGFYVPRVWYQAALIFAVIMWPMSILCVSIGGVSVFVRADLMVYSVLSTFVPYTMVWLLLLATGGCGYALFKLVATDVAGRTSLLSRHFLAGVALLAIIMTFASIVAMRVIGLYYRHFKHRFAWSWE